MSNSGRNTCFEDQLWRKTMMTNIENLMSWSDDLKFDNLDMKFDDLKDNEQTETTINDPKFNFPESDSNTGGNPVQPDENDSDETTISIGN